MAGSVPDLPGLHAPREGAAEIMEDVSRLLHRHSLSFPGAQPVSFTRKHIKALMTKDYLVCEKSDGLRCLMFLSEIVNEDGSSEERIYLITRKSEVSWVQNMHIPAERSSPKPFQVGTLIDGELVLSNDGKTRFFMFDILAYQGKLLMDRTLEKRLGYLDQLVYQPFARFSAKEPQAVNSFDFKVYMKTMSQSYRLDSVLKQHRGHASDGLIFTSVPDPYICGTDEFILKWKPAEENSVDFAIRLDFINSDDPTKPTDYFSKPVVSLLVWAGKVDRKFDELYLTDQEWENWKNLNEALNYRIVEVSRDSEKRWRFLRFRDDKDHGNHIDVVHKVLESIEDGLSLDELSTYIKEIETAWKEREISRRHHRPDTNGADQPPQKRQRQE